MKPVPPCLKCNGFNFWRSSQDQLVRCATCQPPSAHYIIAERLRATEVPPRSFDPHSASSCLRSRTPNASTPGRSSMPPCARRLHLRLLWSGPVRRWGFARWRHALGLALGGCGCGRRIEPLSLGCFPTTSTPFRELLRGGVPHPRHRHGMHILPATVAATGKEACEHVRWSIQKQPGDFLQVSALV